MENIPVLIRQLEKISQVKPESLEKLFAIFPEQLPELWRSMVIGAYINNDINLSKASELLVKHPIELRREFMKQGIPKDRFRISCICKSGNKCDGAIMIIIDNTVLSNFALIGHLDLLAFGKKCLKTNLI